MCARSPTCALETPHARRDDAVTSGIACRREPIRVAVMGLVGWHYGMYYIPIGESGTVLTGLQSPILRFMKYDIMCKDLSVRKDTVRQHKAKDKANPISISVEYFFGIYGRVVHMGEINNRGVINRL